VNAAGSGQGSITGSYKHGNEHSVSVNGGNLLTRLTSNISSRQTLFHVVSSNVPFLHRSRVCVSYKYRGDGCALFHISYE
jgi:hypothetical protein